MSALLLITTACSGDEPVLPAIEAGGKRACADLPRLIERTQLGYFPGRSPDILPIAIEPNYIGTAGLPVHTGPWDYLANVPLLVYGPGLIRHVEIDEAATMADVAPTIAGLVGFEGFDAPDGRDLSNLIERSGTKPPTVIATIVWDGGGDDMLEAHERQWPYLRRLMRSGAVFPNMTVGSTPSNTPAIHTTLGTGAFPNHHGIVHVRIRSGSGAYVDPFAGNDPKRVLVPTLADVYDRALGNTPQVALLATVDWHLGMIGHGAQFPRGDRDAAALIGSGGLPYGNAGFYDVPQVGSTLSLETEARRLDARDGALDGRWLGNDLHDEAIRVDSPAWVRYQQTLFPELLAAESLGADTVPDLFFENFKSADAAGHRFGMGSAEVGADIAAMDDALHQTVADLNRLVGRKRWVLLLTADHGFTPYPRQSGAWPISGRELKDDMNEAFDETDDDVELVFRVTSAGIYVNRAEAERNGVDDDDLASWLIRYTVADNARSLPAAWADRADETLFEAVLVGTRVAATACSNSDSTNPLVRPE